MEQKIAIAEDNQTSDTITRSAFGGEAPTVTIIIRGAPSTGRSTIAGIVQNTIKKNIFAAERFKADARILIVVETG